MELYRAETREILKRFFEDRISRTECIAALDSALVALIPELDPVDLPAVQATLAETYRMLAENSRNRKCYNDATDPIPSSPESQIESDPLRSR